MIRNDLRAKAMWLYQSDRWPAILKVLVTDGTAAMILYRLMQSSRRWRLVPLEMLFNKLNAVCCNCIIGRGAEFGPGFVLIHSTGVVINGQVRGGSNIYLEHQVTIGAQRRTSTNSARSIRCVNVGGCRFSSQSRRSRSASNEGNARPAPPGASSPGRVSAEVSGDGGGCSVMGARRLRIVRRADSAHCVSAI